MNSKTLLIMAAGLGSRFGGEKQFVPFGPCGESLLDYSIYDALECGFTRIILVIRQSARSMIEMRYSELFEKTELIFCTQEDDTLPAFFDKPANRTKPYGTSHALMCAAQFIDSPTLIINSDDFYGKETFRSMAEFMDTMDENQVGLAGFTLSATLSCNGAVTRGICSADNDGNLISIKETHGITVHSDGTIISTDGGVLSPDALTSMNVWTVTPAFSQHAQPYFDDFFNKLTEDDMKSELPLPVMIDKMLSDKQTSAKVIPVTANWIGVTYIDDLSAAKEKIQALHKDGTYPTPLFS